MRSGLARVTRSPGCAAVKRVSPSSVAIRRQLPPRGKPDDLLVDMAKVRADASIQEALHPGFLLYIRYANVV